MAEGKAGKLERLWGVLERVRNASGWERKMLACSYMHHRDSYPGTQVEWRETHDSSAVDYLNTFLSGFVGYMMPEDDTWCELVPRVLSYGEKADAARWSYGTIGDLDGEEGVLKQSERYVGAVLAEYAERNYYSEMRMMAKDYLVMGTGYLMVMDYGDEGISYRCLDPQEVCIAEDGKRRANVMLRRFTMDARDVIEMYPGKAWPRLRAKVAGEGGESSDVHCIEAILPRGYLGEGGAEGRAFEHLLYVEEEEAFAFEGGFDRFVVACVRRNRDNAKTPYGIGLCEECLPLIIELDDLGRIRQVMRQKNADPPMVMTYALERKFSSRPGARNYVPDMSQRPMPAVDQYNASELLADIQDMRAQLRSLMGADLFRTVMGSTDSRKTAYEVSERKNEAMTLLQMQIGTFKQEAIEPVFKRTLEILERHGVVSFEPYVSREKDVDGRPTGKARMVSFQEYLREMRLELNSVFVRRVQAYMQYQQNMESLQVLQILSQIFPQSLLNIDENAYIRSLLYGSGMPKANMRELGETKRKQAEWGQQIAEAQRNEQMNIASGTAANLAKAGGGSMGGSAV